jgi:uncharacterized membrane protein YfcA
VLNWPDLAVICGTGLVAAFVGSVAGTGGTQLLLPVLVLYFGIQDATVLVTVGNLSANLSRTVVNRKELDLKVVGWFALGALPLAVLGTWLFTLAAPAFLTRLLGAFMLGVVVWRRVNPHPPRKRAAVWFLPVGAGFGFLSGLVAGIGPLMAPFYLAYGLTRNAYIGTDAFATVFMQAAKLGTLGARHFVTAPVALNALALVPFMIGGTLLGKRLLERMPEKVFAAIIEAVMVVAGLKFLIAG